MTGRHWAFLDFIVNVLRGFLRDHALAIRQLYSLDVIERLIAFVKRLLVIWPSALSLLLGLFLLSLPQVTDMLMRAFDPVEYLVFAICLPLFWIVPLHLGARILLNRRPAATGQGEEDGDSRLDKWLARDLSILALIAFAASVTTQALDSDGMTEALGLNSNLVSSVVLLLIAVVGLMVYLTYLGIRERTKERISPERGRNVALAFAMTSLALLLLASFTPLSLARSLGGLLFFPLLVGGWIMPVVGLIVWMDMSLLWRRIIQTSLVIALILGFYAEYSTGNRFHDVRTIAADPSLSLGQRQYTIGDYISRWQAANCSKQIAATGKCVAILVAAQGGASRAAYEVATVMGDLLDKHPEPEFRSHLFMFSGVSGGSLGVATVRQALHDSVDGKPPCKTPVDATGRYWMDYGTPDADRVTTSWRKCLQLLVSGDYLTPAMVGLALRDWWMTIPVRFGAPFQDRSALLEIAMEAHYERITGLKCAEGLGLCSRFGYQDLVKQRLPALMLNSTLVEKGQSVVVSDVDPASSFPKISGKEACRPRAHEIYPDVMPVSFDMFELMGARRFDSQKKTQDRTITKRDLRMSTAIVTSARFPVISTHGNVRNDEKSELVGRIVDGGYFDNSGLSNLMDVVSALNCYDIGSLIISIRNDPIDDFSQNLWVFPKRGNFRQPILNTNSTDGGLLSSAAATLFNVAEGHIQENRYGAINRVGPENYIPHSIQSAICLGKVGPDGACLDRPVRPKSVSMSWWLSAKTQRYIDIQDRDTIRLIACTSLHCRVDPSKALADALAPVKQPNPDDQASTPVTPGFPHPGLESLRKKPIWE